MWLWWNGRIEGDARVWGWIWEGGVGRGGSAAHVSGVGVGEPCFGPEVGDVEDERADGVGLFGDGPLDGAAVDDPTDVSVPADEAVAPVEALGSGSDPRE